MGLCKHKCEELRKMIDENSEKDKSLKGIMHRFGQRGKDKVCSKCEFALKITFIEKEGLNKIRCFCCSRIYKNGGLTKRSPDHPKYHGRDRKKGNIKVRRY